MMPRILESAEMVEEAALGDPVSYADDPPETRSVGDPTWLAHVIGYAAAGVLVATCIGIGLLLGALAMAVTGG